MQFVSKHWDRKIYHSLTVHLQQVKNTKNYAQIKFSNFQIKKSSVLCNHIPSLSGEYEFRHPFLLPLRYVSDDDLKLAVVPLQYSGLVKTSTPAIFDQTLKKLFTLTKKGILKH